MKTMLTIAKIHNWFADRDFLWWPFASMRPEKNEIMTFQKATQIAAAFAGLITAVLVGLSWMQNQFTFTYILSIALSTFLFFWLWFGFITKPLWNIRARGLKK